VASERRGDVTLPVDPDLDRPEDARSPERARRRDGTGLRSRFRLGILATIAAGGALGGAARYLIERALPTAGNGFPWATFGINVSGSLALAVLLVFVLEIWPPTRYVRPFAAIGFLGAYTTFSTWMVETAELVAHGRPGLAAGHLAGSLVSGLAAVSLGLVLGRAVLARRTRTRAGTDTPSPSPVGRS
jgi:protein CrcB